MTIVINPLIAIKSAGESKLLLKRCLPITGVMPQRITITTKAINEMTFFLSINDYQIIINIIIGKVN